MGPVLALIINNLIVIVNAIVNAIVNVNNIITKNTHLVHTACQLEDDEHGVDVPLGRLAVAAHVHARLLDEDADLL